MSEAYAPFGEPYTATGSTDVAFTGQNQDTIAGLDDFPAREYSYQGRWSSPDPAGLDAVDPANPQSWNRYGYVMNNPLNAVDPLGLCPDDQSWGAQLCRAAQAFGGTSYFNTWNEFDLLNRAFTPTGTVENPACPNGDCALGVPKTLPVYGNIGLLSLQGQLQGGNYSGMRNCPPGDACDPTSNPPSVTPNCPSPLLPGVRVRVHRHSHFAPP